MLKTAIGSCLVLACGLALAASAFAQDAAPVVYTLVVGSNEDNYNDDTQLSAGGGDIGGTATIRINGNPVTLYSTAARFLSINQMLQPGENKITIEGKFAKKVYVKIGRVRGDRFLGVVAKKEVSPDADDAGRELVFKADVGYAPPFYADPEKVEDTPAAREGVWKAIEQIRKYIAAGQTEEAAARLFEGPRKWITRCYNVPKETSDEMRSQQTDFVASIRQTLQPLTQAELKFSFGPKAVMVWAGVEGPPLASPYLFTVRNGDEVQRLPHLIFVRMDGRWVVW